MPRLDEEDDHKQCDQCPSEGTELELTEGPYHLRARLCAIHRAAMIDHFAVLRARVLAPAEA